MIYCWRTVVNPSAIGEFARVHMTLFGVVWDRTGLVECLCGPRTKLAGAKKISLVVQCTLCYQWWRSHRQLESHTNWPAYSVGATEESDGFTARSVDEVAITQVWSEFLASLVTWRVIFHIQTSRSEACTLSSSLPEIQQALYNTNIISAPMADKWPQWIEIGPNPSLH